jgi:DNA-binding transcriptional MerR regulator
MLGVSLRTLDRYQAAGKILPCPVPASPRMFRVADLEKLTEPKPVNAA